MGKYLLYVLRWVVLAVPGALFFDKVRQVLGIESTYLAMMISQALMGAMVYFVDRLIFGSGKIPIPWEVGRRTACAECGHIGTCYRVAGTRCCDTSTAQTPPFLCQDCAVKRAR